MLDMISNFLTTVDDFVWGIPLIVLILATGLFLTARLRFLQITKLPHAIKHLIANEKSGEDGEVSSFAALCTALSATIGTGNIVGVATASTALADRNALHIPDAFNPAFREKSPQYQLRQMCGCAGQTKCQLLIHIDIQKMFTDNLSASAPFLLPTVPGTVRLHCSVSL